MNAPAIKSAEIHVSQSKALIDYLAMGPDRSLSKLHQFYTEAGLKPPSMSSLKVWSSRFGWQHQAAAYDKNVQRTSQSALIERQALKQAEDPRSPR